MPEVIQPSGYRLDAGARPVGNLYPLAQAALAAYRGHFFPGFVECHPIETLDVCGYAAANDEHVVIAFRGSTEEREWARGRHFSLTPVAGGRAHTGFTRLVDSIWEPLLALLYDTRALERSLWLTGHSAGGALALIATLRLEHAGFEPAMTATFGSPRVLDRAAATSLRTPVLRVENADDPVPHIPWPSAAGYAHAGTAVRLMPSGAIAEARHTERIARRIDRVNELFHGRAPSGMRHDHQMVEYARKLARYTSSSS